MKKIFFAIFFLPLFLLAQTPGYLGKKFCIGYHSDLFFLQKKFVIVRPAPGFASNIYVQDYPLLNVAKNLDIEYTTSVKHVFGISLQNFKTGTFFEQTHSNWYGGAGYDEFFANLSSTSVILNAKIFSFNRSRLLQQLQFIFFSEQVLFLSQTRKLLN